jgi:hypothetical protein
LSIRQFPLHFTANVAEAGLANEPTLRMMGTLFPEAAPEGTRTLTWLSPRGHPGVWRRGCAPWDTFVSPQVFADYSDSGGKTPVEMQAKANTVHLRLASRRFPDGRFTVPILQLPTSGLQARSGGVNETEQQTGVGRDNGNERTVPTLVRG